jgi:hypothetical protein
MGTLKIINRSKKIRAPIIIVIADDQPLGEICALEPIKQFTIKPGNHNLEIKVGSYISDKYNFNIEEHDTKIYSVEVRNRPSVDAFSSGILPLDLVVNAFILLYYVTFGQRDFITIRDEVLPGCSIT